jgi:hypothetical protein
MEDHVMQIAVTFKTPDAVDSALDAAGLEDEARLEAMKFIDQYVRYGEYITVVFDTESKTVHVRHE